MKIKRLIFSVLSGALLLCYQEVRAQSLCDNIANLNIEALKAAVNTYAKDINGCSNFDPMGVQSSLPLSLAIINNKGIEFANVLIEAGADVDAEDFRGHTPLEIALAKRDAEMLRFLLQKGANAKQAERLLLDMVNTNGLSPEEVAKNNAVLDVLFERIDVNLPLYQDITLLQAALQADNIDAVKSLLEKGADPNIVDSKGRSALYFVKSAEAVNLLAAHGADFEPIIVSSAQDSIHQYMTRKPLDYILNLAPTFIFSLERDNEKFGKMLQAFAEKQASFDQSIEKALWDLMNSEHYSAKNDVYLTFLLDKTKNPTKICNKLKTRFDDLQRITSHEQSWLDLVQRYMDSHNLNANAQSTPAEHN